MKRFSCLTLCLAVLLVAVELQTALAGPSSGDWWYGPGCQNYGPASMEYGLPFYMDYGPGYMDYGLPFYMEYGPSYMNYGLPFYMNYGPGYADYGINLGLSHLPLSMCGGTGTMNTSCFRKSLPYMKGR